MKIGYARVSTHEQNLDLQLDALKAAGCERIFEDKVSGSKAERPGLETAKMALRAGDTLVVWRLDRLGRSLKHLIEVVTEFSDMGVGFQSLTENLDTTTNGGRLLFHVFGALAEFERGIIQERTKAGLSAARARGRVGGRPKKLTDKEIAKARRLLSDPEQKVTDVAKYLRVSRATLYRALKESDAASSTGKSGRPVSRSNRNRWPIFVIWAAASIRRNPRRTVTSTGGHGRS